MMRGFDIQGGLTVGWRRSRSGVFPGSSAEFWFSGEVLRIHVENFNEYWQNYLGCILDQVQSAFYLKKSGETVIEVRCRRMSLGCIMCCFLRGRMGVMS